MKTYRRRLDCLLLFDTTHELIWSGDILFLYATVGFILFRDMSHKRLFFFAVLFYYMRTLLGIHIFYDFARDLWGTMGTYQMTLLVLGIYAFQILFSLVWLKYFAFGPLKWGWRYLTYNRLFPIRRS